jgi:hypothetical protein
MKNLYRPADVTAPICNAYLGVLNLQTLLGNIRHYSVRVLKASDKSAASERCRTEILAVNSTGASSSYKLDSRRGGNPLREIRLL